METLVIGVELDLPQSEIDALAASTAGITDGVEAGLSGVNDELGGMADGAEGATGSVRGLSSVTRLFSSDLAKGAAGVTALTRGVAGFSLALGPAVIAVGALLAVSALYRAEQDRAAAVQERSIRITDALRTSALELRDVQQELAVATGDLSIQEARINKIRAQGFIQQSPAIIEAGLAIVEVNAKIAKSQNRITDELERAAPGHLVVIKDEERKIAELGAEYERLNADRAALVEGAKALIGDQIALVIQTDKNIAARAALTAETKALTLAEQELATAHQFVAGVEAAALASMETGAERLIRLREEQLAQLHELDLTTQGTADTDAARAALIAAAHQELMEIRSADLARLEQEKDAAFDKEMARIAKERSVRIESMNTIAGGLGTLSGIAMQAARDQADTDKKAAAAALATAQRLATAEATINLASGIIAASARLAGRPIATGIAIAGLLATYAGQIATIQSASLHAGGFRGAPDEVQGADGVTRTIGERTISPTGSRQEEQIRRLERGGGGQQAQLVPVYRHFGRFSRDELRRQSPLSGAISAASRLSGPGRY